MARDDRPTLRPGQVYWNRVLCCLVVVYGRAVRGGWRIVRIPEGTPSYGKWRRVPRGWELLREPKR